MTPEQAAVPPTETQSRRLAHFWLVDAPRRLNRPLPRVTDILVDGAWTAAWPPAAAFGPPAAFIVGLLAPLLWPGIDTVFSESLPFMVLVSMTAILSGPAGLMLWLGYIAGDLALGTPANTFFFGGNAILDLLVPLAARAIPYVLLAVPAMIIPLAGRRLVLPITNRLPDNRNRQLGLHAGLYAMVCGVLTFWWAQGMIVLIRPAFTWVDSFPNTASFSQAASRWHWLVAAAMTAALVRVIVEDLVLRKSPRTDSAVRAYRLRWLQLPRRGPLTDRLSPPLRAVLVVGMIALALSGTYTSWTDAAVVIVVTGLLEGWRLGLVPGLPGGWRAAILRVPPIARVAAAPVLGFLLAYPVALVLWSTESLRMLMMGALLTLVVFYLLFPDQGAARRAAS